MFETDGSNALKREYELPEQQNERQQPKRRPSGKKKGLSARNKAAMLAAVAALFILAFTVLIFKAALNTEYKNLSAKKAELNDVTSKVEQLTSELEGAGGIVAVDEKAAELGLQSASSDQIVYISLDDSDKGEILAEDKSGRGIHLFFNKVAAVMEYLY